MANFTRAILALRAASSSPGLSGNPHRAYSSSTRTYYCDCRPAQVPNLRKTARTETSSEYWEQHPEVLCKGPQEQLSCWVVALFPSSYPGRFYNTVEKLELPTTGAKALPGCELEKYLQKTWSPRVTHPKHHRYGNFIHHLTLTCLLLCVTDTTAIHQQGLGPEILDEVLSGQATWQLKSTPPRLFYVQLHSHLKEKKISEGEIGTVYTKIDIHFQSYRPDNAYRAVERACNAKKCNPSDPMPYFTKKTSTQVLLDHASCTPIPRYKKRNVDRQEARRYKNKFNRFRKDSTRYRLL